MDNRKKDKTMTEYEYIYFHPEDELYKCESIENKLRDIEHYHHLAINESKRQKKEKGFNWQ